MTCLFWLASQSDLRSALVQALGGRGLTSGLLGLMVLHLVMPTVHPRRHSSHLGPLFGAGGRVIVAYQRHPVAVVSTGTVNTSGVATGAVGCPESSTSSPMQSILLAWHQQSAYSALFQSKS